MGPIECFKYWQSIWKILAKPFIVKIQTLAIFKVKKLNKSGKFCGSIYGMRWIFSFNIFSFLSWAKYFASDLKVCDFLIFYLELHIDVRSFFPSNSLKMFSLLIRNFMLFEKNVPMKSAHSNLDMRYINFLTFSLKLKSKLKITTTVVPRTTAVR